MSGVSVVIITYNEGDYIEDCLKSVAWADEIVVVDMGSTDDTIEKCRRYADRIIPHPWHPVSEPVLEFGMSQATCDWILMLDPDERVNDDLAATLRAIASDPASADGYALPFVTMMFGKEIRHSGWGNEEHTRFFRNGKCTWPPEVHSPAVIHGMVAKLSKSDGWVTHDNYRSINQFIEKLNRYTDMEAKRLYEKGRPFHWLKLFYQPSKEFFNRYIKLRGYKDGLIGLFLAVMMAFYTQVSYIKLWEIYNRERGGRGEA